MPVVGEIARGRDAGICPHLRAHQPAEPGLCITGLMADDKPHVEPVHVFSEANARLIAAAPDLVEALARCHAVLNYVSQWGAGSFDRAELADVGVARDVAAAALTKAGAAQ